MNVQEQKEKPPVDGRAARPSAGDESSAADQPSLSQVGWRDKSALPPIDDPNAEGWLRVLDGIAELGRRWHELQDTAPSPINGGAP